MIFAYSILLIMCFMCYVMQTVTLLCDLGTVLEAQGRFDEAYTCVKQALDVAQKTEHPNQHVILGNMAMILLHQGIYYSILLHISRLMQILQGIPNSDFYGISKGIYGISAHYPEVGLASVRHLGAVLSHKMCEQCRITDLTYISPFPNMHRSIDFSRGPVIAEASVSL